MGSEHEIVERYSKEASCCTSLSCGDNLQYAGITLGDKVLDLGCGRGKDVFTAAEIVGKQGFVLGVDVTPAMVEQAEAERVRRNLTQVKFITSMIETIPWADQFFDIILSNCVINHTQDKAVVYQEIFRLLKPGGRFIVSDVMSIGRLPDNVKNNPHAWAACYGGALPWQEYRESVIQAGFSSIEILHRRAYLKEGHPMESITFRGLKEVSTI